MLRATLLLAMVLAACGGSTSSNDCGTVRGQDCGQQMSVTMKYVSAAGPCTVVKTMPAEQFYWAVIPMLTNSNGGLSCPVTEQSTTAVSIDCTNYTIPPSLGRNAAVCDWTPPVLR